MQKRSLSEERRRRWIDRRRDFRPKLLFFAFQLLLGVGLDLLKRHSRSWVASFRRDRQARHDPGLGIPQPEAAADSLARRQEGQQSETRESIRGKPYFARLLSLLKGTVKEWSRDKCPQLGAVQDALNTIWDVKPKPNQGFWGFIRARFLSFAMVCGVCFLLLVSLTVENLIRGLHNYLQAIVPGGHYVGLGVFYVFDLGIVVLLFAMIFRYLPDAKIAWRDVWTGAA